MTILCIFIWQRMKKNYHKVSWKDKEKVQIETLDDVIDVEMGSSVRK